ncbi:MAG: PAS domain S-box protein [candidate division Zixibacteria bacterium]|nr:PAS domain S-box protein [candidate division Zixibacteria bacterium]
MENKRTIRQGWFLPLRLATYIILVAVVVFWMSFPGYLRLEFIIYSFFTLSLAVALAIEKKLPLRAVTQTVIVLQFIFEIIIDSAVIYATGNVNSPFSALLLLTIVSAALAYRLAGTLIVASLVSVAYAFIIWFGLSASGNYEFTIKALRTIFSTQDSVFYSIFIHILIFYLVAFISGYLAEKLSSRDRELADTSLALRRARLETDDILRHLNSGLLTVDAQGAIIYFNQAAEKILGYREEDVKGMQCEEVFSERMPELARSLREGLQSQLEYPRKELEIINGDRRKIPLGLSTSILTEDRNILRGVIAIFSDLTDAKVLENKVRAADRLAVVGELSASIAHEIRNPLAAISGSVEVLKNELQLNGENTRLMELIIKESHRLSKILSDFLLYARIGRPNYCKVELCHLLNDIIEITHHHDSFHHNIDISLETDEAIVYVVGDEDLIKQLLMNLAINACEAFDGTSGRITFKLISTPGDENVTLLIQDDGPGIPDRIREKIFQPFYSTKKQGTGLGLSIVHRICTLLKLSLNVESQVGAGTTFIIEFKNFTPDKAASVKNTAAASLH